ncbi:MAG: adenylate/guanylate cyclase domain-containing protein [Nitrososphaeraceae archaeon]
MILAAGPNLVHANFFFIDIVGLSDPSMSTMIQIKKIEVLNNSIISCVSFSSAPKETLIVLPTGDGMAIGFLQGPELPLRLAVELHTKLAKYNKSRIPAEIVRVRIGIHSGPVFVVKDVLKNNNVWGPGIIIARRIMDIGDDGHILLSRRIAEDLREISDEYKSIIRPLYDYTTKHSQKLFLYSAYGKGFGNAKLPNKSSNQMSSAIVGGKDGFVKSEKIALTASGTIYPSLEVDISIKNFKTMLVHYKRLYEIQSLSDDPIYEVIHGIATDVDKTFEELNVRVVDENNIPLRISSIPIDKPFQKEFTTTFNRPILKSDKKRRYYTLEYDIEEKGKYFENYFATNCGKFVVTIEYPPRMATPVVYEVNIETDEVIKCRTQPILDTRSKASGDKKRRIVAKWVRRDIIQGQSFRFQWS